MIEDASPIAQAFVGTLFTWAATAAGAAVVFVIPRTIHPKSEKALLDIALGFAAGVMLAASYWSLLAPAFEFAEAQGWNDGGRTLSWIPVSAGFILGALFVFGTDALLPDEGGLLNSLLAPVPVSSDSACKSAEDAEAKAATPSDALCPLATSLLSAQDGSPNTDGDEKTDGSLRRRRGSNPPQTSNTAVTSPAPASASAAAVAEGGDSSPVLATEADARAAAARARSWRRILLLVIAVTVHNFPEGLAVGVGFGSQPSSADAVDMRAKAFSAARALAIGIGLQNVPEGMAVSLPLLRAGRGKWFAFFIGQLSGMFEVIAGVLGAAAVRVSEAVLPVAMAFAAGAMVFVVAEQIIPEANASSGDDLDEAVDEDAGAGKMKKQQGGFCKRVSAVRGGTLASLGLVVGFVVMMAMDVAL